jgi:Glycosyltransferase family 87
VESAIGVTYRGRRRSFGAGTRRALELVLLGALPLALTIAVIDASVGHAFASEFRGNLWLPGRQILDGHSPYDAAALDDAARLVRRGHPPAGFELAVYPTYPAPTLLLGVPFALVPFAVARWAWFLIALGCPVLALRVVGVRDWRAYGATYLSIVVISGAMLGSLTLPLLVGLALVWRYRDKPGRCAAAAGAVVLAKLFLWPLVVWLFVTGRRRAGFGALLGAGCVAFLGWAVIGFDGLTSYPHLLATLNRVERDRGYSLIRSGIAAGLTPAWASVLAWAIGLAILGWCRRMAVRGGDERAFTLAVLAALVLSPIVWQQYYALLFVPIAILQKRFRTLWLAPLLFWLSPFNATEGHPERLLLAGAVLAIVAAATLKGGNRPPSGALALGAAHR